MRTKAIAAIRAVEEPAPPRYPRALRLLIFTMGSCMALVVVFLGTSQDGPKLILLIPLLVLTIAATHRELFFSDETAINGSIAVICAAFVVFRSDSPILGPAICAITAGLHFAHLRRRVWSKVIVNAAATGLAAVVGAATFSLLSSRQPSMMTIALVIPVVVVSYWLVNNLLIAIVLTCVAGDAFPRRVVDLIKAESVMVFFGIAGGVGALVFREAGTALGVVTIAALLVVIDLKVLTDLASPALNLRDFRRHSALVGHAAQLVLAAAIGFVGASEKELVGSLVAVVGALVITYLVALLGVHRRLGIWDLHLALGVAIVDTPLVVVFAAAGALAVAVDLWVALLAVSAALVAEFLVAQLRRRRLARRALDDLRLASAVELAVLDTRDRFASSR